MDRWQGKVAIVTGASSGIGAAIAEVLVHHGCKVVGLARRKEKVEELSEKLHGGSGKLYAVKTDITKEGDILAAFKWAQDNLGPVHILINNAGIGVPTTLMEGSAEDFRRVLDTNVFGLIIATREAIKSMKANNVNGHIIHINSIVGHYIPPMPNLNVYPASKYAITALSETLRHELNLIESKIKVTSISPGLVDTDIFAANGYLKDQRVADLIKVLPKMEARDIANSILYVLGTPPHMQVTELILRPVGEVY